MQDQLIAGRLYPGYQIAGIKLTRHYDREAYTHAMNYPIQSSAWEVLTLAILMYEKSGLVQKIDCFATVTQ